MTALKDGLESHGYDSCYEEDMRDAWVMMVRSVLSTTRIDSSTKGMKFELFSEFLGDISDEHVSALQSSDYGRHFKIFISLWCSQSNNGVRHDISDGAELFMQISAITHSSYREIRHLEKAGKQLTEIDVLKKARFLTAYYWNREDSNFDVDALAEKLNAYLVSGIEWEYLDRMMLKMCVRRAYDVEAEKGKSFSNMISEKIFGSSSVAGACVLIVLRIFGYLLPRFIFVSVIVGVFLWSINNFDTNKHLFLAYFGLIFSVISGAATIISYGNKEIRKALRWIIRPPYSKWNEFEPFINADLYALDKSVNNFGAPHVNLRLAREQLIGLQKTEVQIPIQLLTLIDRAIAKGCHYW